MGAGAVGCYIGGRLQAAGVEVFYVGRPRVLQGLKTHGLRLTDLDGQRSLLPPSKLQLLETPPPQAALTLLCVKSGATAEAAAALARVQPGLVISFQNGVSNTETAATAAPDLTVLPGMVPFNVAEMAAGHFHRGTSGELAVQDHTALDPWAPWFESAGLPLRRHADLRAVQWGKLLLNLNNPINALSGQPLRQQLLDRELRSVLAALQEEALAVLARAGIQPARLTPLPPRLLPRVLRLPTWAFRLVAARMLRIDERARSSMADDLRLSRLTEIDALCGELVRLAREHGMRAPLNERMVQLVQAWPSDPRPRGGRELGAALAGSRR